ncbi:hypothetical protein BH09BAC1_BH09BAC1_28660 [soil metagenome]
MQNTEVFTKLDILPDAPPLKIKKAVVCAGLGYWSVLGGAGYWAGGMDVWHYRSPAKKRVGRVGHIMADSVV